MAEPMITIRFAVYCAYCEEYIAPSDGVDDTCSMLSQAEVVASAHEMVHGERRSRKGGGE